MQGCKKPQTYSEVPAISFSNFLTNDTTDLLGNPIMKGKLSFYLIDGNGDIGLNDYDTTAPWNAGTEYYNNLYLEFFTSHNGVFVSDTLGDAAYRVPYVEPQGQNKTLKCTINIDIDFIYNEQNELLYDSIMYRFYIYDRALNKSNLESTGLIILP
ncbi:MAG: hypothetical protein CVU05_01190 [Bacteroidetes bacterium HGW-Bacteroidetes-21]|nr:MAG: hypothetical protein CVU05_01190 [Bacteroidetes bacterium HGW-Bacteroidetes-21]